MATSQPRQTQRANQRAAGGGDTGDTLDDTPRAEPLYSPVCTYCREWGAHPDRWQFCTAYPAHAGVKIPQRVWDGRNLHMYHIANPDDHGVVFNPDSAATKLPANLAAAMKKRDAQEES